MLAIPGYTVESLVYRGERTIMYRAVRDSDGLAVAVKGPVNSLDYYAGRRLREEMRITDGINSQLVPRYLDYLESGPFLVAEWVDGVPLDELIPQTGLDLERWFQLAGKIAGLLMLLQEHSIVHRDIKPANIVQRSDTGDLVLLDFGHAVRLSDDYSAPEGDGRSTGGTAAYISPEQTGRLERNVDYRSDMYSAGICLYQMLLGRPPFSGNVLELVHAHLARTPVSPSELDSAIPEPVSAIVMKLLEKLPEDRYSSAAGLINDLEEAAARYRGEGSGGAFVPGMRDPGGAFFLSEKLVGREEELRSLRQAVERSRSKGAELLLVAAESGIGKSALLREFVRRETGSGRYSWVISGRCRDTGGTRPGLVEAATDLVFRILGAHEDEIGSWVSLLQGEAGESLQVLRRTIPAFALISGAAGEEKTGPPHGEEGQEHLRLVSRAIGAFFHLFSSYGEGLVIVLDDIHLASRWELETLRNLLTLEAGKPLLILAAYRPEGMDEASPLFDILGGIPDDVRISTLLLRGLDRQAIGTWLAGSLGGDEAGYKDAAAILEERFSGSPAFIHEALRHLHDTGKLVYRQGTGWSFDRKALAGIEGTESIRRLIFDLLDRLDSEEQGMLSYILCFGGAADEGELFGLASAERALPALRRLHDYRVIRHNGRGRWELTHPGFAGYIIRNMPGELLREKHLEIGRFLLSRRTEDPIYMQQRAVFHLAQAGVERFDPEERKKTAASALHAAAARLAAGECDTGMKLIDAAESFLNAGDGIDDPELITRFHLLKGRCLSSRGEMEQAIQEYELLTARPASSETLMTYYAELIEAYSLLSRFEEALDTGRKAFELAGIGFLSEDDDTAEKLREAVSGVDLDHPESFPRADTPLNARFLRMAINLDGSVYSQRPDKYGAFIRTLMLFVLTHGGGSESAFVFALYGLVLATREHRYREAERFGRAGVRMSDAGRISRIRVMCRETFAAHIAPWTTPLSEITSTFQEGYRIGHGAGEAQFTGFILMHRFVHDIFLSADFNELLHRGEEFGRIARTLRNREAIDQIEVVNEVISLFLSGTPSETARRLARVREILARAYGNTNYQACAVAEALLLLWAFIFGDDEAADEAALRVESFTLHLQENYIHAPAVMVAGIRAAREGDKPKAKKALEVLKRYERGCRENFGHLRLMLEAEMEAMGRESQRAGDMYEKAIKRALKRGDLFHAALANELCAGSHHRAARVKVAGLYYLEAYRYWNYLGVRMRAGQIKSTWSALFPTGYAAAAPSPDTAEKSEEGVSRSRGSGGLAIDAMAMVRASRELTEDLREEPLIEHTLRIILESTGAQKIFFIVEREDELFLRARYLSDGGGFELFPVDGSGEKGERLVRSINLSIGVLRFVRKRKEPVILEDAAARGMFMNDPYFRAKGVRSVLCFPMPETGAGAGMVYLENETVPGLFTPDRVELVSVLVKQAAVSLQNARLYEQARSLNRSLQEEILRRNEVEEGLRSAQKELRLLNEELEERVRERTKDLERSYRDLQETQKQLMEAEKLASLGSLVAGIAHEINTPVGVAVTASTFLQEQSRAESPDLQGMRETADLILRNLKRAGELIGSFKQVAVDQASEALRSFDLRQYLEDVVISLRPGLRKSGVKVELEIAPGIELKGYPGALSQIFTNLISNSLIHAYGEGDEGTISIEGKVGKGMVTLLYRDDGKGMDEETVRRVFDPFFTTRRGSGGSGLGMNIVYNIVTGKLGGTITCESSPGEGVLFRMVFPAEQERQAQGS